MTLLEVTVAMMLFVTGVLATVTAMDSGTDLVAETQRRVQATQIASSALEQLRSVAYEDVGLSRTDPDAVGSFEGLPTVRVDEPSQPARNTITEGSTEFVVTRHITWSSNVDLDSQPRYKRLTAIVSWDAGRESSVRLDSAIADGSHTEACRQAWTDPATSISGTINTYVAGRAPVASGAAGVPVGALRGATPIEVGDLLLLMEMDGPEAGRYEYAMASSAVTSGWLSVTGDGALGGLVNSYGKSGAFQVVRVPTYGDVSVAAAVTAAPWDGTTGGIVALDSTGTVRAGAGIDATAMLPSSFLASTAAPGASQWSTPAGSRSTGVPLDGGGVVAVRAAAIVDGAFTANGTKDGRGGVVAIHSTAKPTDKVTASAAGSARGVGGTILSSVPLSTSDVSGKPDGNVVAISGPGIVGVESSVGCAAAVETTKSTSTPRLVNAKGGIGRYELTVRNAESRGIAQSVVVADTLADGVTYLSTTSVRLEGDAQRPAVTDPNVGDRRPTWATFLLPPGSAVTISFSVAVGASVPAGSLQNRAVASYVSDGQPRTAAYLAESATTEDIFVTPFECREPWTDPVEKVPGGVVNTYYAGRGSATVGSTRLAVGAPVGAADGIARGDLLLIVQMQDAFIDPSNSKQYGDGGGPLIGAGATDIGNSGRYEYVVATSDASGGTVDISGAGPGGGTLHAYTVTAATPKVGDKRFQVVRVPTFPSVTLGEVVRPWPWDGAVGGVVAFDVAGTLTFDGGVVDASSAGFRGGAVAHRPGASAEFAVDVKSGIGGSKGEGIAGTPLVVAAGDGTTVDRGDDGLPGGSFGSGAPANAGGGGAQDSGGGGGSNHGAGGVGASSADANGGVGGAPIVDRPLLGGGGGSSVSTGRLRPNAADGAGQGGRGGGIVLVRALDVGGTGAVLANGQRGGAPDTRGRSSIGGGGGGAGGFVLLSSTQPVGANVAISARGGDGGSVDGKSIGAGGGGGGGAVQADTAARADVAGGANGAGADRFAATAGAAGSLAAVDASAVDGLALGIGCRPLVDVGQFSVTKNVERVDGATATWAVAISNAPGRATIEDVVIDDLLPAGWSYVGTASIDLDAGASRTSVDLPSVGDAAPRWGTFVLPPGGSVRLVVEAVQKAAAAGVHSNTIRVAGNAAGIGHVVLADGNAGTADDVLLSEPKSVVTPRSARVVNGRTVVDGPPQPWDATDGVVVGLGAPTPRAVDAQRTLRVDGGVSAIGIGSGPIQPNLSDVTVELSFAAPSARETVCVVVSLSANGGAPLLVVGDGARPAGCVTGTAQQSFSFPVDEHQWTREELSAWSVTVAAWSPTGAEPIFDRAGLDFTWAGTRRSAQAISAVSVNGRRETSLVGGELAAADRRAWSLNLSSGSRNIRGNRYVEFDLPAVVAPRGASDVVVNITWAAKRNQRVCWVGEAHSKSKTVATFGGTAADPTCVRASGTSETISMSLGPLTAAELDDLSVRWFLAWNGNRPEITVDAFSVEATWAA